LNVVDDDLNRVRFEIACAKNLLIKRPEQSGDKIHMVTGQGWLGHIPLNYLGIEIAIFRHDVPAFNIDIRQK
jgi:hypothetical protein